LKEKKKKIRRKIVNINIMDTNNSLNVIENDNKEIDDTNKNIIDVDIDVNTEDIFIYVINNVNNVDDINNIDDITNNINELYLDKLVDKLVDKQSIIKKTRKSKKQIIN
jgi:hypothetical protein